MNPFEMVVLIVLVVTIGRVIQARAGAGRRASTLFAVDPDADRLRDEVRQLKERIQVLERVITDDHQSVDLDRRIEQLRDR